ncbi:MAG: HDOD domain-containing protein [Gammaproteobacteria bacterium]|nr:HDOD domain-containing protein [Gammaproteobacteria bacterium]
MDTYMLDACIDISIKPTDLPSPPQIALQIMRACSQENVSAEQLSELASSDPVLAAELLRVVNSVHFGLATSVQSITRAIAVLGRKSLRNLALCLSIRDALKKGSIPGFAEEDFWEDSIRRASAARALARELDLDGDEYFTAGLLQDFGLLVLFYLYPEKAESWQRMKKLDPVARCAEERYVFTVGHEVVGMMLGEAWELPESLTLAIGHHHLAEIDELNDDLKRMCKILYCAEWIAAVYRVQHSRQVLDRCLHLMEEYLAIDKEKAQALISQLPNQVENAAAAMGLQIVAQEEFDAILQSASIQLAEQDLGYQELIWQLENTLRERDRLASELNHELSAAREVQQSLLPHTSDEPFPIHGINIPARELSGDFYDYFTLPDGRIYFALGDVSGKGAYAALLMAKTCSLFRCLGKVIVHPDKLLARINNEICETSIRGMFVTMIVGLFDPMRGTIELSNAGHPPALLFHSTTKFKSVEAQAPPVGIVPDCTFPAETIELGTGSLYLFSDGLIEGHIEGGECLGLRGMAQLIVKLNNNPASDVVTSISERITESGFPLRDDVTVMLVRAVA